MFNKINKNYLPNPPLSNFVCTLTQKVSLGFKLNIGDNKRPYNSFLLFLKLNSFKVFNCSLITFFKI